MKRSRISALSEHPEKCVDNLNGKTDREGVNEKKHFDSQSGNSGWAVAGGVVLEHNLCTFFFELCFGEGEEKDTEVRVIDLVRNHCK